MSETRTDLGLTVPLTWVRPVIPEPMYSIAKGKLTDEKSLIKYARTCAAALEMESDGLLSSEGKPIKSEDLFIRCIQAQVEAAEAEARRAAEAKVALDAYKAKMARVTALEAEMKEGIAKGPETITWAVMKSWADRAKEAEAFLAIHGGDGEGSGLTIRFKGSAPSGGGSGKGRATGGGKKGGTETRTSAWAEAKRGMKKGDTFRIRRETLADGSRAYFDDTRGGLRIDTPLSKYVPATYPDSFAAKSIKGYEERRKAAKRAGASA